MSKSNLKNINKLATTKNPYILYTNSTYSNLLYKLQKSCAWSTYYQTWLNFSIKQTNENVNFMAVSDFDTMWVTYGLIKNTFIKYNPNPMSGLGSTIEVTSVNQYSYVDIDIVAYFQALAKAERRRQRKLQEYRNIYKKI